MNLQEARDLWEAHRPLHESRGAYMRGVRMYVPDEWKHNYDLACDAMPELAMDAQATMQTDANSAVPLILTTMIDPSVFKVLFAPNRAAEIFGEQRKGTWLDETAMFPQVEHTGEVSSYGDFNNNGRAGVNTNWPQRQSYLFQVIKKYGERELERAGLARINWVSEIDEAAATVMNKFSNYTYFFGVLGLQNYGLLNDPGLSAALTPATKAGGGTAWLNAAGIPVATANEIYADIQAMFWQMQVQTAGLVTAEDKIVLAMAPTTSVALKTTNSFNVNVYDLLKKNFPNIRFETAVQYGAQTAGNPQGVAAGNMVQMFVESIEGQDTGYCAFNEKARSHPIIRQVSSFEQKQTAGTWGAIIRMPFALVQMIGV